MRKLILFTIATTAVSLSFIGCSKSPEKIAAI